MTVLNKVRRGAPVPPVAGPFTDAQLQHIVDAELDAQVLLVPGADGLRVTHANAAARTLLGETGALPDLRSVALTCRSVWEDGRPVNLTNVLWPGDHHWYDIRVRKLYGRVSVVFTDVTKRHESQDALIDSQCRYRLLAENAGDLVFQIRGKRLEWVSASVADLLGWDQTDVIGHRVIDVIHPQDRDGVLQACEIAEHPTAFEARFRHRNGSWIWMSVLIRPAMDLGGGLARIGSGRVMVEQA